MGTERLVAGKAGTAMAHAAADADGRWRVLLVRGGGAAVLLASGVRCGGRGSTWVLAPVRP